MSEYLPEIEGTVRKIFPQATRQLCMVRTVRDALSKARKDDREGTFQDLKAIYRAASEKGASKALEAFKAKLSSEIPQDRF